MSVYEIRIPGLFLGPHVCEKNGRLISNSHWLVQFLLLFSYGKTVEVDPAGQKIDIKKRYLWCCLSEETVPFDDISFFGQSFGSLPTSWSFVAGRTDEMEYITIWIIRNHPLKKVKLWTYLGEGSVKTGLRGAAWGGDSLIDFRGNQQEVTDDFFARLSQITQKGKKFIQPRDYP